MASPFASVTNSVEPERALLGSVTANGMSDLPLRDFAPLPASVRAEGPEAAFPAAHGAVADQGQMAGEPASEPNVRTDRPIFARYGVARLLDERGEMRPIGALEEEVIRFAISHYRGRMSEVARRLGIGRSTLYRKVKDYGIASVETAAS